jgi:aspartyl-tRNA(Asn)/glutamyl-tRNA(Gln) amidotransferase subunit C
MKVDESLIDHLANLARLEFSQGAKQSMIEDMQQIIGFVEKLNELDTTGVPPARFMGQHEDVTRLDDTGKMLLPEEALSPSPNHNDSFFKVPKIIKR